MFTLNCKGRLLIAEHPIVMGILNITPDSFYAGSRLENATSIIRAAEKMIEEGATILDIGGQSTRPNAQKISSDEETERIIPAIELIKNRFPDCFISVDTFYSNVAERSVQAGADIVNDISAGLMDAKMVEVVGRLNVPMIAMHMQGNYDQMHKLHHYNNIVLDIIEYFNERIRHLTNAGIKDIIIDPGFGFSKTTEQNYKILSNLDSFHILNHPILVGVSRKSMIYKTLNILPEEALNGTTVLHTVALSKGVSILRAHDVKEAVECIKLFGKLYQ